MTQKGNKTRLLTKRVNQTCVGEHNKKAGDYERRSTGG